MRHSAKLSVASNIYFFLLGNFLSLLFKDIVTKNTLSYIYIQYIQLQIIQYMYCFKEMSG